MKNNKFLPTFIALTLTLNSCSNSTITYNKERNLKTFTEDNLNIIEGITAEALEKQLLLSPVNYLNHLSLINKTSSDEFKSSKQINISNVDKLLEQLKLNYTFEKSKNDKVYSSRLVSIIASEKFDIKDKKLKQELENTFSIKVMPNTEDLVTNINKFVEENCFTKFEFSKEIINDIDIFSASILSYKASFDYNVISTKINVDDKEYPAITATTSTKYFSNDEYNYLELPVQDEILKILMPKTKEYKLSYDDLFNNKANGAMVEFIVPEIHNVQDIQIGKLDNYYFNIDGAYTKLFDIEESRNGFMSSITTFDLDENGVLAEAINYNSAPISPNPDEIVKLTIDKNFYYALVDQNNTPMFVGYNSFIN